MRKRSRRRDERPPEFVPARLGADGRMVIPAAHRKALGLQAGDTLLLRRRGNELRVVSQRAMIARMQRRLAKLVPPGVSLVDELIAERRREARREADEDR